MEWREVELRERGTRVVGYEAQAPDGTSWLVAPRGRNWEVRSRPAGGGAWTAMRAPDTRLGRGGAVLWWRSHREAKQAAERASAIGPLL